MLKVREDTPPVDQSSQVDLPLRRNLRFQAVWLSATASTLGASVADVAYPLLILAITGSPAWAGLFAAVQVAGMVAAGLPSGVLADRYSSKAIILAAEACRAAITVVVIGGLIKGWLSLPLLLAAAALLGASQSAGGTARLLLLRSTVPARQLSTALTQDEVRMQGVSIAGPALGGALYAVAHSMPFICTAALSALSLAAVALITRLPGTNAADATNTANTANTANAAKAASEQRPAKGAAKEKGDVLAGLRFLLVSPALRAAMLLIILVNTVGSGLDLAVIVLLRQQRVSPGAIGLALGIGAAGALAGIPLIRHAQRVRPGVLLAGATMAMAPVFALLALRLGPWWAAGLLFCGSLALPACRVTIDILVIRQAPEDQRGRVVAALMTLMGLGIPVGMAGCGLLLRYLSGQDAMLVLAALFATGVAIFGTRRDLRQAQWPAT